MDIVSPPAFREESVTDVDFGFVHGAIQSFTLYDSKGDSIKDEDDFLILTLHDEGGEEVIRTYFHALAWVSIRHRTKQIPIDGPVIDTDGTIAQPMLPFTEPTEERTGDATV